MNDIKNISVLFIGNSHTYYNDMPIIVQRYARDDGYNCRVSMLAHGGWFLAQHVQEPDVRFNILYGQYDYVVLQEHAQPFGSEIQFMGSAIALNRFIREARSIPVIYECWSAKSEPEVQKAMNATYRRVAAQIDALIAPVGEKWWSYIENHPDVEMYDYDGGHASNAGSSFAAQQIWDTIKNSIR